MLSWVSPDTVEKQNKKSSLPKSQKTLTQKAASPVPLHTLHQDQTSIVTGIIKIYLKKQKKQNPAIAAFNYDATKKQPYYSYKLFSLSKFRWNYCHDLLKTGESESIPFQSKRAGAELAML